MTRTKIKEKEERKEKRGSKRVSPLALQTQTCQTNNLVVKTVVQEKFIFSSISDLKEVARGKTGDRTKLCVLCLSVYFYG